MNRKFKFLIGCGISTTFILALGTQLVSSTKTINVIDNSNSLQNISIDSNKKESSNQPANYPANLEELRKMDPSEIAKMSKFDTRDFNIVTPVKNQGANGICWAYSIASVSETNMLYKGLKLDQSKFVNNYLSVSAKNIDLSANERDGSYDKMGLTDDDKVKNNFGSGINDFYRTAQLLMQQNSPVYGKHGEYLKKGGTPPAWLNSMVSIPNNKEEIKKAVSKYGSVAFEFSSKFSTNYMFYHTTEETLINHACTIVGWDDDIDPSKGLDHVNDDNPNWNKKWWPETPKNQKGAWIVKNSWGTKNENGEVFDKGYFYLSYDSFIKSLISFDYVDRSSYENLYYYDGVGAATWSEEIANRKVAAIFPAKVASNEKVEKLKGVSFGLYGKNGQVKASVYKNVSVNPTNRYSSLNDPISGQKPIYEQTSEVFENPNSKGNYTIEFKNPIELEPGSYFSIVLEPISSDNSVKIGLSSEPRSTNDLTYYLTDQGKWVNCAEADKQTASYPVASIKALTVSEQKADTNKNNNLVYSNASIEGNLVYSGNANINPTPKVTFDGKELIPNTDFTFDNKTELLLDENYENHAGTLITTIKGNGSYNGEKKIFTPILKGNAPIVDLDKYGTFDKNTNTATIEVIEDYDNRYENFSKVQLPSGYEFKYPSMDLNVGDNKTNKLVYKKQDEIFYSNTTFDLNVVKKIKKKDLSDNSITTNLKENKLEYNGQLQTPEVEVKYNNKILTPWQDYYIKYEDNKNVGKAKIILEGQNYFSGTKELTFEITKTQNEFNGDLEIIDGKPVIDSKYDDHLIKYRYFKDPECTDEIFEKPIEPGTYYVKAYVEATQNYDQIESDPVEFKIDSIINGNHQNKPNQEDNTVLVVSITVPIIIVAITSIVTMFFIKRKKSK